ncbi:MAG: glycerophosphodiester phosphodiesterase [Clostridiaceae bacterium]
MDIFAHRGYSKVYPENTILAFKKALEFGCDGIECDVQMTRDNRLVVIHDEKINRVSAGRGFVKDYSYGELEKLDFGKIKPGYEFQRLPQLYELLDLIKDYNNNSGRSKKLIKLNIELKNSEIFYPGIEEAVVAEVEKYELPNEVIYSSFNHDSIKILNKMGKNLKTAPLIDKQMSNMIGFTKSLGSNGIHPSITAVNERLIKEILNSKMFLNIYTVNDVKIAAKLKKLGVSGIFTDSCKEFKEELQWRKV